MPFPHPLLSSTALEDEGGAPSPRPRGHVLACTSASDAAVHLLSGLFLSLAGGLPRASASPPQVVPSPVSCGRAPTGWVLCREAANGYGGSLGGG